MSLRSWLNSILLGPSPAPLRSVESRKTETASMDDRFLVGHDGHGFRASLKDPTFCAYCRMPRYTHHIDGAQATAEVSSQKPYLGFILEKNEKGETVGWTMRRLQFDYQLREWVDEPLSTEPLFPPEQLGRQ